MSPIDELHIFKKNNQQYYSQIKKINNIIVKSTFLLSKHISFEQVTTDASNLQLSVLNVNAKNNNDLVRCQLL